MVPPDAQPDRPNDNPEQAEFPSSHTLAETSGSRGRGGLSRRGFIRGGAAVGVAAAAAVPTLAGCGAKGGSNLSSAGKPVKGGPKTTRNPAPHYPPDYVGPIASFKGPITTERARLKVVVSQDPVVGDWKINHFSKWYAKRTNVDIDWQVIAAGTGDQSDLITKVNAIIASGDLPDVFMTGFTPSQLALFGQDQRLFIPLDKYIDDYGVETKRLLKEFPVAKQVCTALPDLARQLRPGFKLYVSPVNIDRKNPRCPYLRRSPLGQPRPLLHGRDRGRHRRATSGSLRSSAVPGANPSCVRRRATSSQRCSRPLSSGLFVLLLFGYRPEFARPLGKVRRGTPELLPGGG